MLRKSIRYLDQDRLLVRDEKYLRDFDINFMFDHKVAGINKEKGQHLVELEDGTAIVNYRLTVGLRWSSIRFRRFEAAKGDSRFIRRRQHCDFQ